MSHNEQTYGFELREGVDLFPVLRVLSHREGHSYSHRQRRLLGVSFEKIIRGALLTFPSRVHVAFIKTTRNA